ncbi:MAG: acetate kinase [Kineosporiaceae bacterium]
MSTAPTVLVLNCGSSSVKYRLLEPATGRVLAGGLVERIGADDAEVRHRRPAGSDGEGSAEVDDRWTGPVADHTAALDAVLDRFARLGPSLADAGLVAVGHRVVQGGDRFLDPVVLDDDAVKAIDDLAVLAPLHNGAHAEGIRVARAVLPDVPHVAVFDTAFHATIPAHAHTYAVPQRWRTEYAVRRYGFHGSSHAYVSRETARFLGRELADTKTVVLHLGNGASACAVDGGRSVDTSMGLTPLQGLVMGTRSGDIDPAISGHLARVAGMDAGAVDAALNKQSGMLALAGVSDMREVVERAEAGDVDAELALDVYCYRVRTYVGAYLAAMGGLDAIAFTAGVGENSVPVRARSLAGLERLGIAVDPARNAARGSGTRLISPDGAPVAVLVVPTDEEREIATRALAVVQPSGAAQP